MISFVAGRAGIVFFGADRLSLKLVDKFGMVVGRADATAKLNWFTLFGSYP